MLIRITGVTDELDVSYDFRDKWGIESLRSAPDGRGYLCSIEADGQWMDFRRAMRRRKAWANAEVERVEAKDFTVVFKDEDNEVKLWQVEAIDATDAANATGAEIETGSDFYDICYVLEGRHMDCEWEHPHKQFEN